MGIGWRVAFLPVFAGAAFVFPVVSFYVDPSSILAGYQVHPAEIPGPIRPVRIRLAGPGCDACHTPVSEALAVPTRDTRESTGLAGWRGEADL